MSWYDSRAAPVRPVAQLISQVSPIDPMATLGPPEPKHPPQPERPAPPELSDEQASAIPWDGIDDVWFETLQQNIRDTIDDDVEMEKKREWEGFIGRIENEMKQKLLEVDGIERDERRLRIMEIVGNVCMTLE